MTDARLRDLERRRQTAGSVVDEAAYLRERLRRGELDERRLRLAAHLGHEAARFVAPPSDADAWLPWAPQVGDWGSRSTRTRCWRSSGAAWSAWARTRAGA